MQSLAPITLGNMRITAERTNVDYAVIVTASTETPDRQSPHAVGAIVRAVDSDRRRTDCPLRPR